MQLITGPLSMYGRKVEIALGEKALAYEREMVPFTLKDRYKDKHPVVLRINPKGQVPILIDDGLELFDSTLIFDYLEDIAPESPLWPVDAKQRAQARQWELKSDEVFFPKVLTLMSTRDDPLTAHDALLDYYDTLDQHLVERDYIAGDYSFADIAFFPAQLFAAVLGRDIEDRHINIANWQDRMLARPPVRRVADEMSAWLKEQGVPVPAFLG